MNPSKTIFLAGKRLVLARNLVGKTLRSKEQVGFQGTPSGPIGKATKSSGAAAIVSESHALFSLCNFRDMSSSQSSTVRTR